MAINWTETQSHRLMELDVEEKDLKRDFGTATDRDRVFQELEKTLIQNQRQQLDEFRQIDMQPRLIRLENKLANVLVANGFAQVATPIIMSKGHLSRMSITEDHPLSDQVYWLGRNKCLRPMLAPHLYFVLKDLLRLWDKPVRIFEVGPCFRKETQGAQHASEFTMLNLVEMGLAEEARDERIAEMADLVTRTAGIDDYLLEKTTSEVYGDTIDVVAGEEQIELGSAAMGPHRLDREWKIAAAWIGIGFGLERLLMVAENSRNLGKWVRSLTYLDGIRLNI